MGKGVRFCKIHEIPMSVCNGKEECKKCEEEIRVRKIHLTENKGGDINEDH